MANKLGQFSFAMLVLDQNTSFETFKAVSFTYVEPHAMNQNHLRETVFDSRKIIMLESSQLHPKNGKLYW